MYNNRLKYVLSPQNSGQVHETEEKHSDQAEKGLDNGRDRETIEARQNSKRAYPDGI